MLCLDFVWSEIPVFIFGRPGISQRSQTQPKHYRGGASRVQDRDSVGLRPLRSTARQPDPEHTLNKVSPPSEFYPCKHNNVALNPQLYIWQI